MALAHQSIATISSPQFINLTPLDINPLMSKCEIKVLYIGANRNGSFISKQVAEEMSKTLRGAPIVGYYKEDKQDFGDHGEQLILDGDGIHFNCLTKPYGFVSPDAKIWFKDFEDKDEFGNSIVRTYLMTTGYLWTGQFEQAQKVLNESRPHSMELDEKSLQGHWATNIKQDMEFFIINDAIFSKLCILGDDVEPCFEGSAVTAPQVSASFTLDSNFRQTLFEMMQQLTNALKGGQTVADIKNEEITESIVEETSTEFSVDEKDNVNEFSLEENNNTIENTESTFEEATVNDENQTEVNFENQKDDDSKDDDKEDASSEEDEDEEQEEKKNYAALEEQYNILQLEYTNLEKELAELRTFKENIENQQKEDLINQFYMLSDEDKKDVIENKANYSLEEIESKLAVICFKKKVNFNLENSQENNNSKNEVVTTFNIQNEEDSTPDWIKAVESTMNNRF